MDETSAQAVLRINDLRKSFGAHEVLRGFSFSLRAGQITGLLAKNGAGKSTLISLISGLLQPDGGRISFSFQAERGNFRKNIGVAPQETGIYPGLTLRENLNFAGRLYGLSGQALRKGIDKTTELFDLADYHHTPARNLSGGWKRRLHTAMAVLHEPRLILLDEPTVGSDPLARKSILNAVKTLALDGAAILYTGHYFPEIEELNARIAIMHEGRLVAENDLDTLLHAYGAPGLRVHFTANALMDKKELLNLLSLTDAESWVFDKNILTMYTSKPESFFPDLTGLFNGPNSPIRKWEILRADLESVYFSLTEAPVREETLELSSNFHQ